MSVTNMKTIAVKMLFLTFFVGYFALVVNRNEAVHGVDARVFSKLDTLATSQNLLDAVKFGEEVIDKSKRLENTISGSKMKVAKGSISYAQVIDGYPTPSTQKQDYVARTVLKATSYFINSNCKPNRISSQECGQFLSNKLIPQSKLLERCEKIVNAKTYNDEYRRLLPASYNDGIYQFRKSILGGELPHPRSISSKFHGSTMQDNKDTHHSVALVQWTQFIEHDLAKTTVQSTHDGIDIECCSTDHNNVVPRYLHPSCKPLYISEDDPYYKSQYVTCLNYVRSALSLGDTCNLGPANQLNQATNRLDLSQLYGNHESETIPLRTNRGGKLKSQSFNSVEYLAESSDKKLCVVNDTLSTICYASGDTRVNVNPYVTLLHTLFLRSHNRLATRLSLINPRWGDERLFEVSRKINIRIYRKIVHEWVETILGNRIQISNLGNIDPRVSNEFATAAIRFYNTMMPGEITDLLQTSRPVDLEDLFYKPKDMRKKKYFSQLMSSVLRQNAMSMDTSYVDDMAQLLFKTKNIGTDVLALDIQRGRDHGLNSYTSYYKLCTGRTVESWSDLSTVIKPVDLETLQSAYASVEDVDLIVGAVAEQPSAPKAIVGPTMACIIKDQMSFSLGADEHHHAQIDSILANYSATRFLCDTAQVEQVQRNIFRLPAVDNPQVRCAQLPELDLNALREP
ncbi:peroxidase [Topomyia yanbarensis]|uniref:peroxidase n=1 Tax=Topomyia yanbarensis TaxID=2498891 RepID=UPI00273C1E37|nr:peroxidase [Topomyia yanbarensis]